jgi:hypothetical protein
MVSERDVALVRLPIKLAEAIDQEVQRFIGDNSGLKAHCRWHDADLWLVYQEQTRTVSGKPAILQSRITVAAFAGESGFEPDIVFTPDILVIMPEGRYVLEEGKRKDAQSSLSLQRQQGQEGERYLTWLKGQVTRHLTEKWKMAVVFAKEPELATVLLHSG